MASIDLLISRQVDPIKKKLDNLIGEIATLTPSTSVDAEVKLLSRKVDNMVNEMSKELREIRDIIKKLGEAPKQEPATSNVGSDVVTANQINLATKHAHKRKIMLDSKVVSKSLGFSFGRTTIPQECTTSLTNVTSAPGFSIPSPSGAIDVGQNAIEIAQPFTAVPSFTFATPPAVITASSKDSAEGKFATTTVAANSDSTPAQPSKATGGFSFSTGPSTGTTPVAVDTLSSFGVKPSMGISASATPAPFSFGVSGATPITSASVSAPLGNANPFSQVDARNSEGVASRAAATQPWSNLSSTVPTNTTNLFGLSSVSDKKTEQKGFDNPQSAGNALAPKSSDGATSNPFSINASSGSSFERVDSAIVPNPLVTDPIGDKPLHNSGFSFPNSANHNANVHPSTGKPQGASPNAASWNSSFGTGVFGGGPVQTTQEPTTSTAINTSGTPGTTVNLFSSHVSNSAGSVGFGTVSSFGSSTFLDKAPRPKKKRTY